MALALGSCQKTTAARIASRNRVLYSISRSSQPLGTAMPSDSDTQLEQDSHPNEASAADQSSSDLPANDDQDHDGRSIWHRGFQGLLIAQFFGAMNDNLLKVILVFSLVSGHWTGQLGVGWVQVCFSLPFLLISGVGGQIADRFSKRRVTVWVKIAEVPIAMLAGLGFYLHSLPLTVISLVMLTCQSSFFGPAKYGMIPELVSSPNLSRANGTINMTTNIAVILGTVIAGFASRHYNGTDGTEALAWLPGVLMVGTALMGLAASALITQTRKGDADLVINPNPFGTYRQTIKEMASTRLLMVMLAWSYFYLLAALALVVLPLYKEILDATVGQGIQAVGDDEASLLMAILGIAVGVGCAFAGFVSGKRIEPRLITIGALGLTVFFFLLGFVDPALNGERPYLRVALSNVAAFIFCAGFFAGFYIVPLQAMLQKYSPDGERGRFLGTANAASFAFMVASGFLYELISPLFEEAPHKIFYVCSGLMLVGMIYFLYRLRGTGILLGTRLLSEDDMEL